MGPLTATETMFVLLQRGREKPLYCISAVLSKLIAHCDILAIKKWYMRTHNPPLFFFFKKSENIHKKTRWYNGFLGWGGSFLHGYQCERRWDGDCDEDDDDGGPSSLCGESDWYPCCFSDLSSSIYTKWGWESHSQECTHKYCLFLACWEAARVWSLLKSPESDSKMSSIKIPALHMPLMVVLMHMILVCLGVFICVEWVC